MNIKDILIQLIGSDTSYVDSSGTFVPDYEFIFASILVIAILFMIVKGVFALCKR